MYYSDMTMRILKQINAPVFVVIVIWIAIAAVPSQLQGWAQTTQFDGTLRRLRVPILMYHYISELPPEADQLRVGLTVHPFLFREHLTFLKSAGYKTVSLYEVYLALTQGYSLPANPIVLTFDDVYSEHLHTVIPLLQEFGFIGTFYIITGFTDNLRDGYLTWQQVQQLATTGMEIAAHSKTHPDLRGRDHNFLVYEVLGSLESIRANVGVSMISFAYPMGRYDDATIDMLRQTGVTTAVTTEHGATHTTDGKLELRRLRIQNTTSVLGLQALLREK